MKDKKEVILAVIILIGCLTAGKYMASIPYARIFALVSFTSSLYYLINDYSIARGKPHLYLITTVIGSIAIIFMMPLFVNKLAYSGGAIMVVISYIILFVVNMILLFLSKSKTR